jgi:hypothetical protein
MFIILDTADDDSVTADDSSSLNGDTKQKTVNAKQCRTRIEETAP